ncbi:Lanosterol 14-alpha-demethylase [Rhodotorula kratochvilovae]
MQHLEDAQKLLYQHLPPYAVVAVQVAAALAGLLGIAAVLNVLKQVFTLRDPTQPPRVFHYVPFIGCALSYGLDPLGFFERCREKYGPVFTFPLFGRDVTVALGPLGSNYVLNSPHEMVNAEVAYTNFTTPVFGSEVVYDCPNSVFMQQKRFVKAGLTTENFVRYVPMIVDEVKAYLSKTVFLGDNIRKRRLMDPAIVASEITVLTAAATLQGREVREALDESFAQLIHDLDGGFTPLNFVFPHFPSLANWRRDRAQAKMREFYLAILKKRRESTEEPPADMITALQNQHYKSGEPLTDTQIAHMMVALLMGGQHTSAATGTWAILRLAEDPALQERLYAEQVEHYSDGHGSLLPLTYSSLQTPLLSSFVKELLRVHPPLHSLLRYVAQDISVPSSLAAPSQEPHQPKSFVRHNDGVGYTVRKGGFLLAAPGFTAVDERVWGRDGRKFRPERWLDERAAKVAGGQDEGTEDYGWGQISKGGKSPYLPFGAGRHRCIGEHFALLQLSTLIATLVRETRWTLDEPGRFPKNDYTTMIVMPARPREVTFVRR